MRSENEHPNKIEDVTYKELRLLEEIEQDPELSQRQLSRRMGVALGAVSYTHLTLPTTRYV